MTEHEAEIKRLKDKIDELNYIHQLDMSEIVKLRRMIQAIMEGQE